MLIQRSQLGNKGMFYVREEGNIEAEMTYHMTAPNKMVIEHTEVEEDLRGQNVGYQLVESAVEYARKHDIKITVWCPFAKKVFDKKPEWHDVLDK
jgi:hypothetical protein